MLKAIFDSPLFDFEGFFYFEVDLMRVFLLDLLGETKELGLMAFFSSKTEMSVLNFILR